MGEVRGVAPKWGVRSWGATRPKTSVRNGGRVGRDMRVSWSGVVVIGMFGVLD